MNLIEMAICICMYNEDKKEFEDTMRGIIHNIARLNVE